MARGQGIYEHELDVTDLDDLLLDRVTSPLMISATTRQYLKMTGAYGI